MTDITPGVRPPGWVTVIGTWIGRVRVFAVRVKVIFQLAPILATGAIGLLAGLSIAQWSQQQIAGNSPLARNTGAQTKTVTISAMSWLADDSAVIFFDGDKLPVSFHPSGEIDSMPAVLPAHANDVEMSALVVQPAADGVLTARTNSFELVTPGGLAAIDGSGSLYITGAARIRNTDRSNERGIEATAPNGQTVWRTEVATAPSNQPARFLPALPWDTTVTAMTALPNPGRIAVGGADGRIAFIADDGKPTASANRSAAQEGAGSHGAPVVALAAGGAWNPDQGRAVLASAASDGSIKVWYHRSPADPVLTSREVRFPEGTPHPALTPDSLELAEDGQLLTVRTAAGAMFAARLAGTGASAVQTKGAVIFSSATITLTDLRLDYPTTASALSRRSGASVYVAAPDCSVREVDLTNVIDRPAAGGVVSPTEMLTLRGHGGPISRLAVSHNDQYLAAASLDGRVRIHHLSSLRRLAALPLTNVPTGPDCTITPEIPLSVPAPALPSNSVPSASLSRFADSVYFLTKPIAWTPKSSPQSKLEAVDIPAGFVTTLDSVPRAFWSLLNPEGQLLYPTIIHDYLYWTQKVPRDVADGLLKQAMDDFGVDRTKSIAIYAAVRTAGARAWDENAKLKAQGEKRFLKEYPTDPATRWSEWKTRPGVFND